MQAGRQAGSDDLTACSCGKKHRDKNRQAASKCACMHASGAALPDAVLEREESLVELRSLAQAQQLGLHREALGTGHVHKQEARDLRPKQAMVLDCGKAV